MQNHPQMSKPFTHLSEHATFSGLIKNFAIIAALLFKLTHKDSGYKLQFLKNQGVIFF
jgi:hypothetical protein